MQKSCLTASRVRVVGEYWNAIANDLFGTEDDEISTECRPFWDANNMKEKREEIRAWVKARVDSGEFTDFVKDVRKPGFIVPYPGSLQCSAIAYIGCAIMGSRAYV